MKTFKLNSTFDVDDQAPGSDIGVAGAGAASTTSSSTTVDSNAVMNEKVSESVAHIIQTLEFTLLITDY